ncbi:class I SAM-dependent methyltransferase [Propionibacterium sp. oral taxon 192]|uniref:class I SAM-dependent methyltransferase n=1 Tax=Propionibacterium sp. oral taxon 192 TaxID=671222 RepID=UPI0018DC55C1|nr:class I SAM-dependent methyltransferase [Propionibacterium sp. oral taxon 192]
MRKSALMAFRAPAERILDLVGQEPLEMIELGCNTALLGLHIAGRLPRAQVTGFDEVAELIEVAEENLALAIWANAEVDMEVEKSSLHRLPVPDSCADIVFSFSSMHRWKHPVETLKEASRICRPNGTVVLCDSNRHADEGFITFILQFVKESGDHFMRQLQAAYTKAEAKALLLEAGLDDWYVIEEDLGLIMSSRPLNG